MKKIINNTLIIVICFASSIAFFRRGLYSIVFPGSYPQYDADLTIVDMNMKKVIKNDWIASKCGWTPFDGYEVKGFPLGTIVNGKAIVWDGKLIEKANGKPLRF